MLKVPLVTIIVPCYNSEKFIERCINSVLNQTYNNIQFLMVDDGSTDDTLEIIKSLREKINKTLTEFELICQENAGPSAAVNAALPYVKGKYLAWFDSDDVILPDNIKKKVEYLEKNKDVNLVVCGMQNVDDITGKVKSSKFLKGPENSSDRKNVFYDLIFRWDLCYSGVFMVRTEILFSRMPEKKMYVHRQCGQNWQLLLPVAVDSDCGIVEDILYQYRSREDSHSHRVGIGSYDELQERTHIKENNIEYTMKFWKGSEKKELMRRLKLDGTINRMRLAYKFRRKEDFNANYRQLIELEEKPTWKMKVMKLRLFFYTTC